MNDSDALQAGLNVCREPKTLGEGRPSRATKRKIDFRAYDVYFNNIVDIGKDIFVRKLSASKVALKHQISRRTVQRYKKRLMRGQQ